MQLDGNVSSKQSIQGTLYKINTIHLNAYQIAVQNGFEGTVEEWLASLKGEKGDTGATGAAGADGADGYTPVKGVDYFDGQNGKDGASVTVVSVEESAEDGGVNIVTFSDGTVLRIKNGATGSGANITVDDILSDTSENPVQNKAVAEGFKTYWNNTVVALNQRQLQLVSGENIKTINGESVLGSGDIKVNVTVDSELSETSENPLQNKVIAQMMASANSTFANMQMAINNKQDKIAIPSSVNMSGYDSGTIVETFADGTTKTTTIEVDSDGNPTKITDGDGNVTTYTW